MVIFQCHRWRWCRWSLPPPIVSRKCDEYILWPNGVNSTCHYLSTRIRSRTRNPITISAKSPQIYSKSRSKVCPLYCVQWFYSHCLLSHDPRILLTTKTHTHESTKDAAAVEQINFIFGYFITLCRGNFMYRWTLISYFVQRSHSIALSRDGILIHNWQILNYKLKSAEAERERKRSSFRPN